MECIAAHDRSNRVNLFDNTCSLQERVSNLEKKIVEKEGQEKCTCDKMVETETNETDLEKEIQNLKKTLKNKDDELKRYQTDIASLKQRCTFCNVLCFINAIFVG